MRTRIWVFAALLGTFGMGDQNAPPAADEPAAARAFQPPADGRLTGDHVRMYISVQRAASALASKAPAPATAEVAVEQIADRAGRELSAARRLGVDADEYRWVRATIAAASSSPPRPADPLLAELDAQVRAGSANVLGASKGSKDAPANPAADTAALAHNRELLKKYQRQLDAVAGGR